ncbi:MAG TPA: TetR/AcrR family transcriptional regulator [Gammaproteobacteria bacterium]|jgi:AcrR family transcriptional regulator|nr:TetR/AcrR family transcriptional regulator [Gammaproteobacteria bacterium]
MSTPRPEKREAIVAAAENLFLEAGFPAVSMDAIAARAGVSKQTVYNHFGSKDELFGAIIRGRCRGLLGTLRSQRAASGRPQTVLYRLARAYVEQMLAPDTLALYRTLMIEVQRAPELGETYYRSGPAVLVATLSDYLRDQTAQGLMHVPEPRIAAEQFFAMLGGPLQTRALLGIDVRPPPARVDAYIKSAVKVFLKGVIEDG